MFAHLQPFTGIMPVHCAKKLKFVGQLHINIKTFMHKQAIKHKQAIIGGGYLFTENACLFIFYREKYSKKKALAYKKENMSFIK